MSKASFELFRGQLLGAKLYLPLQALAVAEEAHEGVFRKDGVTPYIEHPMKVASLLFDLGCRDETVLSAAILHDVIEDSKITIIDLDNKYGLPTGNGLLGDVSRLSKNNYDTTEEYYAEIQKSPVATIVKLADRCHNLSTLYNFTDEKKIKYLQETETYVYPLIKYAQHHYYEYSSLVRIFDLWIESLVSNIKSCMKLDK